MELQGDFGIDAGSFSKSDTQRGVNSLSQGAQGIKNPKEEDNATLPNALSDLRGHVLLRHGIATLSNLSFGVPGAFARMQGSYNLITRKLIFTEH